MEILTTVLFLGLMASTCFAEWFVGTNEFGHMLATTARSDFEGRYNFVTSAVPPYSEAPSPLLSTSIAPIAPILPGHPAPEDIPDGGAFYRVTNGVDDAVLELWYVRDADHIATQLSAHDAAGKSIIKTRRIDTGVETVIDIEEVSINVTKRDEARLAARGVRTNAMALIGNSTTNIALIKGVNVPTNASTTQVRSGLISLLVRAEEDAKLLKQTQQELKDLAAAVQKLSKDPTQ